MRGKKYNGEPAKFFNVMVYETNPKTEEPIKESEITLDDGTKVPRYKVKRWYRIAESSLLKVAANEAKSCNLYFRKR